MKKLIAIVLLLALPAMAYGAATISLLSGGSASKDIDVANLPTTMTLDIVVNFSTSDNYSIDGGLSGSNLITITARSWNAVITNVDNPWKKQRTDAQFLTHNLSENLDFGAEQQNGSPGDIGSQYFLGSGASTLVTLTLSLPGTLVKGASYPIGIVDGKPFGEFNGTGYWAAFESGGGTGNPTDWDTINGFTLNITPEPATMLLLAGALPFLRRRTA